ncbi:MAG: MalY/PatB family protein [Acidimicrobiia bacterium]
MARPTEDDHDTASRRQGSDADTLTHHFGTSNVLPLWIAEPDLDLAPCVVDALEKRAAMAWYGYETRPEVVIDAFRSWALTRHGWNCADDRTIVSPSVGTSIGVLLDELTDPGDGVIIQPPVFTDFKPIISHGGRAATRNPLVLSGGRYEMDFEDLAAKASDPANSFLILCNPHNPVGRVWTKDELDTVATICAANDVFVLADEIHADLALPQNRFTPFAKAAVNSGVRWAATHGPIKTFGLAGVCDTLIVTDNDEAADRFETRSSQFHLTRNNVFAIAAFETAYRHGAGWVDELLSLVSANVALLTDALPEGIRLIAPEGTYLAWLDFTALDIAVAELPSWLANAAGLALSPGHWFGREGASFARMTIASDTATIERAVGQLVSAVDGTRH